MPILDLSLSNPNVASFLAGTSQEPPVGEFLYIHTHYVPNNFISQIEVKILEFTERVAGDKSKQGRVAKLQSLAEKLGVQLSEVNEKTAPGILDTLRQVWGVVG